MTQMSTEQFSSKFWWTSDFKCLFKKKIYALILLKVSSFILNFLVYIQSQYMYIYVNINIKHFKNT